MDILDPNNPIFKYKNAASTLEAQQSARLNSYYLAQAKQILENYQFIQHLSEQEKQRLLVNVKIKKYYHNQIIYAQNAQCEDINIIVDGTLKLGWTMPNGKYHIQTFMPSGTLINIVPIMAEQQHIYDHISQGDTILANISGRVFLDVLKTNAQALYMVLKLICIRTQLNREQIFFASTESLRVRLAQELIFLVDYHSYQTHDKILLSLKINQENFAELLQTTRQSINRELSWFAEQGILEVKYNQISILDYHQLNEISKGNNLNTTTKFI
ncbi:Crp/Fnr family transcriptional regulator [Acinetobacter puyangensis]|uniref:cAMP-binding domain of CRP or a regulatory subunit of cAMP-dependent protein kinases n=1 Tax=Acinetobacter puyangensis TaxID=1096779 RepID=A0A240EB87_9GAMM|nr:Crp/Fnr family transcriptional regulator [Acinetobacter puyangensis]SNX45954.1 cAMP-binding domain of CRP or a regulatory subunit of cAMP-dependent protein kinases [Acinetobacter puyangensis]